MITLDTVLSLLRSHKYFAMFSVLFLSAVGLPVPEEVTLIASGFAVYWEGANYWLASLACVLGILASDAIIYAMGRLWEHKLLTSRPILFVLSEKRQARIRRLFERHGSKAVFIARFVPVLRFGVYSYAGQHRMSFAKFLLLDLLGALISGPVTILVGVYAGGKLADPARAAELANRIVREERQWIYAVVGGLVFLMAVRWLWNYRVYPRELIEREP